MRNLIGIRIRIGLESLFWGNSNPNPNPNMAIQRIRIQIWIGITDLQFVSESTPWQVDSDFSKKLDKFGNFYQILGENRKFSHGEQALC